MPVAQQQAAPITPPAPGTMIQLLLPQHPHPTVAELIDEYGWALLVDTSRLPQQIWPEPGAQFDAEWVTERGRHRLPVRLDLISDDNQSWWFLVSADNPRTDQRRYPRGGGGELGNLRRTPQVPGMELRVVDLSERSVRASVDRSRAARVAPGEKYNLQLNLGAASIHLIGTVLRVQDHGSPTTLDVVVLFEPTPEQGQQLRTYIATHTDSPQPNAGSTGWIKRL